MLLRLSKLRAGEGRCWVTRQTAQYELLQSHFLAYGYCKPVPLNSGRTQNRSNVAQTSNQP